MQTFQQRIQGIAERKVLSRAINGKTPNLSYTGLSADEQKALVTALLNEDEDVRELIAGKITDALEDAYCNELRPSEAEEDAIDLRNFMAEDVAERARDMSLAMRGY